MSMTVPRPTLTFLGVVAGLVILSPTGRPLGTLRAASPAALLNSSETRAVVDKFCVGCHNARLKTAGLALDDLDVDRVSANGAIWEKVSQRLRSRSMPPAGRPRPDGDTYDGLAAYFEDALDRAAEAAPNPGRPAIHRLNRVEYANAIRD